MTVRTLSKTRINNTAVARLYEAFHQFITVPESIAHGALMRNCEGCGDCEDGSPWSISTRRAVTRNLRRAVATLEGFTGEELATKEITLLVDDDTCPVKLGTGVSYFGKRKQLQRTAVPLCYTYKSACDPLYDDCLNEIGQLVITDIPDEWDGDMNLVEFSYPERYRTELVLQPPYPMECCQATQSAKVPCPSDCACVEKCSVSSAIDEPVPVDGYCQTVSVTAAGTCPLIEGDRAQVWLDAEFLFGTITTVLPPGTIGISFKEVEVHDVSLITAVSAPHIVMTFEKYNLVRPSRNSGEMCGKDCAQMKNSLKAFLSHVDVSFFTIEDAWSVESACSCTSCEQCNGFACSAESAVPCADGSLRFDDYYDYAFDAGTGELCLQRKFSNCTCGSAHRVRMTYGIEPDVGDDMELAIILRSMLWSAPNIRCGCNDSDAVIDSWLTEEVGTGSEAFATRAQYQFGYTRAGTELQRLWESFEKRLVKDGRREARRGLMTAKTQTSRHGGKNSGRRRYVNPRSNR